MRNRPCQGHALSASSLTRLPRSGGTTWAGLPWALCAAWHNAAGSVRAVGKPHAPAWVQRVPKATLWKPVCSVSVSLFSGSEHVSNGFDTHSSHHVPPLSEAQTNGATPVLGLNLQNHKPKEASLYFPSSQCQEFYRQDGADRCTRVLLTAMLSSHPQEQCAGSESQEAPAAPQHRWVLSAFPARLIPTPNTQRWVPQR